MTSIPLVGAGPAGGASLPTTLGGLKRWSRGDEGLKTGGARQFTASNAETLSLSDNALVSGGDVDFAIAVWVYLDAVGNNRG